MKSPRKINTEQPAVHFTIDKNKINLIAAIWGEGYFFDGGKHYNLIKVPYHHTAMTQD